MWSGVEITILELFKRHLYPALCNVVYWFRNYSGSARCMVRLGDRTTESTRLEKTFEIIQSNL